MTDSGTSDSPTGQTAAELRALRDWHIDELVKLEAQKREHRERAQELDTALMLMELDRSDSP